MSDSAASDMLEQVWQACRFGVDAALSECEQANHHLREAVSDAYHSGVPAHVVADWLGWSKATYWRFLASTGITTS